MNIQSGLKIAGIGMLVLLLSALSNRAKADSGTKASFEPNYKVQVEYWYWDSDYYYWGDFYESTNYDAANFVYVILDFAREMGTLNQAAPNINWKFFAVDVRIIVEYKLVHKPKFLSDQKYPISSPATDRLSTR